MTGRPTTYSTDLGDRICALLAEGMSLREICRMDGMPEKSTVLLWVVKGDRGDEKYAIFSDQYRRAREAQSEALLDEVIEIADETKGDFFLDVKTDGGTIKASPNIEHIQRSKLRIETRFRAAAKMHPRKYGEKIQQEVTGKDGEPVVFTLAINGNAKGD